MITKYSKKVYSFMLKELNIMGPYQIERTCKKLGLNPYTIRKSDMPKVVNALSNVVHAYKGRRIAREFVKEMRAIYDPDEVTAKEERPEEKVRYLLELGETQFTTGHVDKAEEYFKEALEIARSHGLPAHLCCAHRNLGDLYYSISDFERAGRELDSAAGVISAVVDPLELARTSSDLASLNWRLGNLDDGMAQVESAIEISRSLDDMPLLGESMVRRAMILNDTGNVTGAIGQLQEAIQILEESDDFLNTSRAYNNIAVILRHHGQIREALRYFEKSLELANSVESPRMRAYALANIAKCNVMLGEVCAAREGVQETSGLFSEMGDRYMLNLLRGLEAWIADHEGRQEDAEAALQEAIATFREMNIPVDLAWELFEAGQLYKKWGRTEADVCFKEAIDIFKNLGNSLAVERVKGEMDQ